MPIAHVSGGTGFTTPFSTAHAAIYMRQVGLASTQKRLAHMNVKPEAGTSDTSRQWLRHCVATLAYRGAKALRDAPDGFAEFRISETTQSSGELLAHIGDLLAWALSIAKGKQEWHNSEPLPWDQGVKRFFGALEALDVYLASPARLHAPLFQGPIADALTHVGQIATRRRLAGAPVRGENYFLADIVPGRVGPEQSAPRREFD